MPAIYPPQSSARPRSADHLLHIDAGCGRYLSPVNLPVNTLGHRPSTKVVDQNGGVENDQLEAPSAYTARVRSPLRPNRACRISVPLVALPLDRRSSRLDERGSSPTVQLSDQRVSSEGAPAPVTCRVIYLTEEIIVDLYVHSHVPILSPRRVSA